LPDTSSPSFDVEAAREQDLPHWRLNLPADPSSAEEILARLEAQQSEVNDKLAEFPQRFEHFLTRIGHDQTGSVAFSHQEDEFPAPERELLSLIRTMNNPWQEVSFSQGEDRADRLDALFGLFRTEMDVLLRITAHLAWIETRIGGTLIGRTIVSWSGDINNTWSSPLQSTSYELHRRSLAQALVSRFAVLRSSLLILSSAARLAPLLANPAGAILSLPLAWNFLRQILTELETYHKVSRNLP
jgi:hypothetical protein